jgi:hypothetical protein
MHLGARYDVLVVKSNMHNTVNNVMMSVFIYTHSLLIRF